MRVRTINVLQTGVVLTAAVGIMIILAMGGCKSAVFYEKRFYYPVGMTEADDWELSARVRLETRGGASYESNSSKVWFIGLFDRGGTELAFKRGNVVASRPEVSCNWDVRDMPEIKITDQSGNAVLTERFDLKRKK